MSHYVITLSVLSLYIVPAVLEQCTQHPGENRASRTSSNVTIKSLNAPFVISPDDEQCKGADLIRWYYDIQAGTCLRFTYDGCGNSNSNMFVSRAECLSICANSSLATPHPNLLGTSEWVLPYTATTTKGKGSSNRSECSLSRLLNKSLLCMSHFKFEILLSIC